MGDSRGMGEVALKHGTGSGWTVEQPQQRRRIVVGIGGMVKFRSSLCAIKRLNLKSATNYGRERKWLDGPFCIECDCVVHQKRFTL